MPKCRVLVVDDDVSNRVIIAAILEDEAFAVTQAVNMDEALRHAGQVHPEVVVLDMMLPRRGGKALAHEIKTRWPEIAILAMSALPDALPSLADGDFDAVLAKPFEMDDLLETVRRLCPVDGPTAENLEGHAVADGCGQPKV